MDNNYLKEVLEVKLKELNTKVQKHLQTKEELQRQIKHVDVEITQLVGAINEISKMIPKSEKSE